jgi:hypothetical protein
MNHAFGQIHLIPRTWHGNKRKTRFERKESSTASSGSAARVMTEFVLEDFDGQGIVAASEGMQ